MLAQENNIKIHTHAINCQGEGIAIHKHMLQAERIRSLLTSITTMMNVDARL